VVAKKPPPIKHAEAIVRASRNLDKAQEEFELAIVDALRAGGSIRLVADVAGIAYGTVVSIGKKHGWPDAAEKKRRVSEQADRQAWRDTIDRAIRDL
jgi:hypothetical protein